MIVSPCRCLLWYGSSSSKSVTRLWLGLKVLMPGMRSPCPNGVVLAGSLSASVGSCQLSESHQRSMTWVLRKPTTRQGDWSEGWELSASRRSCGLNFLKEGVWDAICVKDEASDEAVSSSAISIRWVGTPLLTSRSIGKYKPSTTARSSCSASHLPSRVPAEIMRCLESQCTGTTPARICGVTTSGAR